jgi:hypothetical protein
MIVVLVGKRKREIMEKVILQNSCPFCGVVSEVVVENDAFGAYLKGALAQDAFPGLSASDREVIISGICDPCFPSD